MHKVPNKHNIMAMYINGFCPRDSGPIAYR